MISSRKNEKIISASKLSDKKARDKEGLFFVEGAKLLEEANLEGLTVRTMFFTEDAYERYKALIDSTECNEKLLVTSEVYEKITDETSPQGIFAVIKKPSACIFNASDLKQGGFLILEDVQNPLNIGAIFRCAYALGTSKIILSKGCADVYNPKVLRSAMGSIFKARFTYVDSVYGFIKDQLTVGNRVLCTALKEDSAALGSFPFLDGDNVVIGNEGNGVKDETINLCKNSIIIPMTEGAESLNAATACSVMLWEMNKQKLIDTYKLKGE